MTVTTASETYNGWANYETWNVALYINNEYAMYQTAVEWVNETLGWDMSVDYDRFRHTLAELFGSQTPDGVRWDDDALDHAELTEMLKDL